MKCSICYLWLNKVPIWHSSLYSGWFGLSRMALIVFTILFFDTASRLSSSSPTSDFLISLSLLTSPALMPSAHNTHFLEWCLAACCTHRRNLQYHHEKVTVCSVLSQRQHLCFLTSQSHSAAPRGDIRFYAYKLVAWTSQTHIAVN